MLFSFFAEQIRKEEPLKSVTTKSEILTAVIRKFVLDKQNFDVVHGSPLTSVLRVSVLSKST